MRRLLTAMITVAIAVGAVGAVLVDRGYIRLPGGKSIVDIPDQQPPPDPGPDPEPAEPPKPVHSILGRSNRLTANQWTAMSDWRDYARKFAADHPGVYLNGWPEEKTVCLTFDDGPDSKVTARVLDILEQYRVKASFFFIGSRLDENRDVAKRAFDNGNLVLSHTWSHTQLIKKSADQIKNELKRTEDKLYEIIGARPAIIRPPFGDIDDAVAQTLAEQGYSTVLWSIDTLDWSQQEKDNIVRNVVDNVRSGDIILMHSNAEQSVTADALAEVITQLQLRGYHFATLSDMLGVPAYR